MGDQWIMWLMAMLFGFGGTFATSDTFDESVSPEGSDSGVGGPSFPAEEFFGAQGVPDCGFASVSGRAAAQDPSWQCLDRQRQAGLGGRLMSMGMAGTAPDTTYYLLGEDGTLTVWVENSADGSTKKSQCPAPTDLWRGCR